jgi:TP901 family phage tail tape measure protein
MASATVGLLKVLLTADSAEFQAALKKASSAADAWSKDMKSIGTQAQNVGSALTRNVTLPIVGLAAASVKAAMDFESAFANVGKTVEGVSDKFGKLTPRGLALANSMRAMAKEMPQTVEELSNIAAMGGQMGVPIDNLAHFTKNVAALGVAVDGIGAEEAAMGLAQIANVYGDKEVKKIAEMSSAMVHLGNSSNATEADILEFTKRLSGAGKSAGMTIPEVMAIGTAMANVGINAEAGGTAMSTMIQKMSMAVSEGGAKLKAFDAVVAHTGKSFTEMWKDSPTSAVNAVVVGLSKAQAAGQDLNLVVKEIGATGIRTADTMKRLAGAGTGVADMLKVANEGWAAGDKHLAEAEKKYATTANQLKILWNQIKDVGITLGNALLPTIQATVKFMGTLIPVIEKVAQLFANLPGPVQALIVAFGLAVAAAGPLLWVFGSLVRSAADITAAFGKKGIATRLLATEFTLLSGASGKATAALSLLGKTAAVAAAAFVGWQIGRLIADLLGLDQKIADTIGHINELKKVRGATAGGGASGQSAATDALVAKERELAAAVRDGNRALAARLQGEIEAIKNDSTRLAILDTINKAIKNGANANITYAEAVKFNAEKQREAVAAGKEHTATQEASNKAQEGAAIKLGATAAATEKKTKAEKEAEKAATAAAKAAEKHAEVLAKQADALEKLGIVTENQVLKSLGEFGTLVKMATDAGVPLDRVLVALAPHLEALKVKADASGVEMKELSAQLDRAAAASKKLLDGLAKGMPAAIDGLSKLPGEMVELSTAADIAAQNVTDSFKFFGLMTQAELQATASAAVAHFKTIRDSGTATPQQIQEAFEKMNAALVAAGMKAAKSFADTMKAALKDAFVGLGTGISQSIADGIETGDWTTAKDQIQDQISNFLTEGVSAALDYALPGLGRFMKPFIDKLMNKFVGLFRDSAHEHTNDIRDAFLLTFGPGGTGAESGFGILATQLEKVQGGAAAFKALLDAKTPEAFAKAMERVNTILANTPEALAAAAGFQTKAQLEAAAVAAVKLHAYMRDSGLYTAAAVQEAWEKANAALIAAGHAGAEAASKASEEIEKLKGELKSLNESVAAEETEEVMGVIETQQRARIAAIEEEIKAKEEAIEAERQAREEAAAAAAADAKSYSDQRKAEYDSEYAYLADLFSRGVKIPATFVYSNSPGSAPSYGSRGGVVTSNGIIPKYMAMGGPVNWKPRGSDTVPAMLDPTEVVLTEGHTGNIGSTLRDAMAFVNSLKQDMSARVPGFSAGPVTSAARPSITVLQVDKRELGRAVADVLPGELRRLGVRVQA